MNIDNTIDDYLALSAELTATEAMIKKLAAEKRSLEAEIEAKKELLFLQSQGGYENNRMRITKKGKPPALIITDEKAIPDNWYIEKTTRSVDKRGILSELKKGNDVDGCMLSNGGQIIQIEVK